MTSEQPYEASELPANKVRTTPGDGQNRDAAARSGPSQQTECHQATVIVRGETVRDSDSSPASDDSAAKSKDAQSKEEEEPAKELSETKLAMRDRLPALDDDADIAVQKDQLVIRDGKADLAFTGTLLASAAPPANGQEQWDEYRIYETTGGKHVFSKVNRSVFAKQQDHHKADVFEPSPSSVPSALLRSARDLARSRPLAWTDAAVTFFGYGPLAKALYRKLGDQFEEHIA